MFSNTDPGSPNHEPGTLTGEAGRSPFGIMKKNAVFNLPILLLLYEVENHFFYNNKTGSPYALSCSGLIMKEMCQFWGSKHMVLDKILIPFTIHGWHNQN